jgi:hypothetical protein
MEKEQQSIGASWLNIVAGIWLIIAPFVLGYFNGTARTNDIWLGIIVGVLAIIHLASRAVWSSWLNVIAGIWLIIAPFVLQYPGVTALWNDVILGILVAAFALWSSGTSVASSRGHGHAGV